MPAPLSQDDLARLHMESRANPMTITAVLWLDAPIAPAEVDALVRDRLASRPRFRDLLVESPLGGARWEPDPSFDLREHVHHVGLPSPDDAAFAELVDDLASTPLDTRQPLWQVHFVTHVGDGCALVVRVHHVVADGLALVDALLAMSDEGRGTWSAPPPPRIPGGSVGAALSSALSLASLVTSRAEPATPLRAHPTPHKHLAWTAPLPIAPLRAVARRHGVAVTAALLALTAGALRRVLDARGSAVDAMSVRAMVPFSLRSEQESASLGNRYASVFVALPVDVRDVAARLSAAQRQLQQARVTGGVSLGQRLVHAAAFAGRLVERAGVALLSRRASLVVSNVPGPAERRHLAGVALRNVAAFAPVTGEVALGVTYFGYGGDVTAGVAAALPDAALSGDLARAIATEHAALCALA